jgi:hypothetical protein
MARNPLLCQAISPRIVDVASEAFDVSCVKRDRGITLCGFVRHGKINVYSEPWRIQA